MIKRIEELSMNAWPSLQTNIYDGWIIRFANGYKEVYQYWYRVKKH